MIAGHLPRVVPMPTIAAELPAEGNAEGANRRLYHRYSAGLEGELVAHGLALPCKVRDISLGGASLDLVGEACSVTPGMPCVLRAPALADAYPLPAEVRNVINDRINLAFVLSDRDDFELTMFLMDSPATLDTLSTVA
jgi:hypothetical protein